MKALTEKQARELAENDRWYTARCMHGEWCVWDAKSNHEVEFEYKDIEAAR